VTQYTWDADSRLIQVTQTATYGGTATQIVDYLYDAEGRWIGETVTTYVAGTTTVQQSTQEAFVYDGNQIVLQFSKTTEGAVGTGALSNADLSHRYLCGPAVDQLLSDEQIAPASSGQGYNVSTPGTVVWPLTDNVGTVRDLAICDLTTGTTAVVNHLDYNSFGQLLSQTNPATGNTAAVDCLFGFTGRPLDTNTGLQNNGRRWYNASLGRWESPDPDGFTAGDANLYRYVGNSPANATDPTGLYDEDVHFYFTYYLATYLGLDGPSGFTTGGRSVSIAYIIAWMDEYVDQDSTTGPFSGQDARTRFHFVGPNGTTDRDDPRVSGAVDAAAARQDFALLGILLHTYQDSYAHEGYGPRVGHLFAGHDPDRPYRDEAKAKSMAHSVFNKMYALAKAMHVSGLENKSFDEFWAQVQSTLLTRKSNEADRIAAWRTFLGQHGIEINFDVPQGTNDPWVALFRRKVQTWIPGPYY
jgi:RHS repeat-associated protein